MSQVPTLLEFCKDQCNNRGICLLDKVTKKTACSCSDGFRGENCGESMKKIENVVENGNGMACLLVGLVVLGLVIILGCFLLKIFKEKKESLVDIEAGADEDFK